jgi:hypothetical protein
MRNTSYPRGSLPLLQGLAVVAFAANGMAHGTLPSGCERKFGGGFRPEFPIERSIHKIAEIDPGNRLSAKHLLSAAITAAIEFAAAFGLNSIVQAVAPLDLFE